MAFFSIRNLSCSFGKNIILKNVSFDCEKNQAIALLGKSGSGKSTLLNCIANYVDYSGNIYINSKKVYRLFSKIHIWLTIFRLKKILNYLQ